MRSTALAEEAATRAGLRKTEFGKAKTLHEGCSRRSGSLSMGTDEEGIQRPCRTLKGFHIVVDRWYVRMGFKKEDHERLKGQSWQEIEARLKDGDVPRTLVRFDTHIISAVRTIKHLRSGYQSEIAETDALLAELAEANLALGERKRGIAQADIEAALAALGAVDEALARKEVAVKKMVARGRIAWAAEKFRKAASLPEGGQRDMEFSRGLAVMVSIRNRLSAWRDRQVAGIVEFNLQKECALRLERDRWLFSQLSRFSEMPQAIHAYSVSDRAKIEALDQMRKMLRFRKHSGPALEFIRSQADMFRVKRRDNRDAERLIKTAEEGIQPPVGLNVDYQLGRLRAIYRNVRDGNKDRAREHIDSLKLFVMANKPTFILDELGKEPDMYLGPVLEALGKAVDAMEAGDHAATASHFASARDSIARFAYPQPS